MAAGRRGSRVASPGPSRRCASASRATSWRRLRELSSAIKTLEAEIAGLVAQVAPQLLSEPGFGPLTAAKLVAQAADRFARGAGDRPGAAAALVEIWHAERRRDVHLRSVEDDYDLRTSATVANLGERTHGESVRKSKSVRKGIRRHAHNERKPWGQPGYGWRKRDDGHWEPVEDEVPIARRILALYERESAFNAVAVVLNAEGTPARGGGVWTGGSVGNVITGRHVLGEYRRHGEWHRGAYSDGTPYPQDRRARRLGPRAGPRRAGPQARAEGRRPDPDTAPLRPRVAALRLLRSRDAAADRDAPQDAPRDVRVRRP